MGNAGELSSGDSDTSARLWGCWAGTTHCPGLLLAVAQGGHSSAGALTLSKRAWQVEEASVKEMVFCEYFRTVAKLQTPCSVSTLQTGSSSQDIT